MKGESDPSRPQYHIRLVRGQVPEFVLLPGDPDRLKVIATLLSDVRALSESREYASLVGSYRGVKVGVVSTGIGGPSAAIALEELWRLGARYAIRVGTTASIRDDIKVGDLVLARAAVRNDGASKYYVPQEFPAIPDFRLLLEMYTVLARMSRTLGVKYHVGLVSSDDAFYMEDDEFIRRLSSMGVSNVDMETATIFAVGMVRGIAVGSIMAVNGNLISGPTFDLGPSVKKAILAEAKVALETFYRISTQTKKG
ncbi:nucleoside phosphorylase [Tardisphaera miroshnichenkoae]